MRCMAITKWGTQCLNKAKEGSFCGMHSGKKNNELNKYQKMKYCYKQFLEAKKEVSTALNKMQFYVDKLYGYA